MPFVDYNIKIIYSTSIEQAFHLCSHDHYATSTFMEINDVLTAYNLSNKAIEQVREFLYK